MAQISETYLAGLNATATINGTAYAIEDGSFSVEIDTEEMTNNQSGGWYEDVGTIQKANGTLKLIYKSGTPPAFANGGIYPFAIAIPNGMSIAGNARLKKRSNRLTVKGGVKFDLEWHSQGAMTLSG